MPFYEHGMSSSLVFTFKEFEEPHGRGKLFNHQKQKNKDREQNDLVIEMHESWPEHLCYQIDRCRCIHPENSFTQHA